MQNRERKFIIPLVILMLIALGVLGFIGFEFIKDSLGVKVPDFSDKSISDVNEWCGSLNEKYSCEIHFEKSKTVQKDKVISQSVNADSKLKDKITFKISSGLIEQVPSPHIDKNTKLSDIQKWAKEYNIETLNVVEEKNDELENDTVIKIEPDSDLYTDTVITVYVAKNEKKADTNIVVEAGTYIGSSVSSFESKVKALGLNPNHNTDRDAYSNNVEKGNIVWHGSGEYENNETINYGVSLGKSGLNTDIVVEYGKYLGLEEDDFISKTKTLGLSPYHNTDRDAYSEDVAKGNIVWHGSGTYVKDERINYGLSLGKKDSSSTNEIYIKQNEFLGLSLSDFESKVKALGLTPVHETSWDVYSDIVDKGKIIRHGYTAYIKGENIRYGLSLGKKDDSSSDEIYIKQNEFQSLSLSEFESKIKALGLNPVHEPSWDTYSYSVEKGKIVRHGYTSYIKGENMRYGLSLGKEGSNPTSFYVSKDTYSNLTVSDFESKIKALGLVPYHESSWDAYSDSIAEGKIVRHGYGDYTKGENMRYGLSLGKASGQTITVNSFAGKTAADLESFLASNGLKGNRTEQYSSSVEAGKIISNDTGSKKKGDTINYVVSKGTEPISESYLASLADIKSKCLATGDYESAASKVRTFLSNGGFTNYEVVFSTSRDAGVGTIMSVTVNGNNHVSGAKYPVNAKIVVTVCNKLDQG